jgi:hypothetical protein
VAERSSFAAAGGLATIEDINVNGELLLTPVLCVAARRHASSSFRSA